MLTAYDKTYLQLPQPVLPLVRFLLAERHINQASFVPLELGERNNMLRHVSEVVPSIRVLARSQPLAKSEYRARVLAKDDTPCSTWRPTYSHHACLLPTARTRAW